MDKGEKSVELTTINVGKSEEQVALGQMKMKHRLMICSDGPPLIWELPQPQKRILYSIGKTRTWEENQLNVLEGSMHC